MRTVTTHLCRTIKAILVGFGFSVVLVLFWIWLAEVWFLRLQQADTEPENATTIESIQFNVDGSPFLSGFQYQGQGVTAMMSIHQDLEGHEIANITSRRWLGGLSFYQGVENQDISWPERMLIFRTRTGSANNLWYFLHDGQAHGRGFFVGYEYETRRRIGFLGTSGFRETEVPAEEMFPVVSKNGSLSNRIVGTNIWTNNYAYLIQGAYGIQPGHVLYLNAETSIYRVDLNTHLVQKVFESEDDPILAVDFGPLLQGVDSQEERSLAIRTASQVVLLDPEGKETSRVKLPTKIAGSKSFSLFKVADDRLIATTETLVQKPFEEIHAEDFPPGARAILAEGEGRESICLCQIKQVGITRFQPDGSVVSYHEIALPVRLVPLQSMKWSMASIWLLACPLLMDGALLLSPVFMMMEGTPIREGIHADWKDISQSFQISFVSFFLVSHLFPLLWGGLAWKRMRRAGLSAGEVRYWTGFVYVCGLCGWVGFLTHRAWPVEETCRSCGRPTAVTRDHCLHCGKSLPIPEPRGIEIIDAT